jgi:hypothetical protein
MSAAPTDKIVGIEPTFEERELVEWGEQTKKNSLPFLNDTLRQLVLIDAALLGGGLALNEKILHPLGRGLGLLCLLVSLAAALWGMLPYGADVNLAIPEHIRIAREAGFRFKDRALKVAASALFAAFCLAAVGLVIRLIWP